MDEEKIQQVWEKGTPVPPNDPNEWRKDSCTAWMYRTEHGNRQSKLGWEVHHIDGDDENDELDNLEPLQWENNLHKRNGQQGCKVRASGTQNVDV